MHKLKIIILLFLSVVVTSCIIGKGDYKKFVNQNSNIETGLQLDGFYYYKYEEEDTKEKMIHPIFLYKDGTVRQFSNVGAFLYLKELSPKSVEVNTYELAVNNFISFISDKNNFKNEGSYPLGWGQYRVINDTLVTGVFIYGPSGIGSERQLCKRKYVILNDTTFVREQSRCARITVDNQKRVYNFRRFSPKQDSINWTHKYQKKN